MTPEIVRALASALDPAPPVTVRVVWRAGAAHAEVVT